eukprot:Gregarina_sp_Poly_1__6744@NODE_3634_length_963_cov_36_651786_g2315_i0_p1_GENE_NODE_3634_length_963_cov_36_651786_g2315_i0NODE_3634_length_963_cov_36_651786_g2315_i0_p1_ORF_typecomplete_len293_score27_16PolyA_pol/PF01743_20/4_9e24PolyA_pol_RNAbd/PF12627_7/0_00089_NODE_3634_length_963_cov_36_651786_g2315_i060938
MLFAAQHEQFRNWLQEFSKSESCPTKRPIRIAGGWVRDALLGKTASDFDVVLEDCSGDSFGTSFVEWLNSDENHPVATVNILERNSEVFRHVRVAKVHIRALKIRVDFTAARVTKQDLDKLSSEELLRHDARHRDLTINALYFNIDTNDVEDPLDMGLRDIRNCILRTPIDAIDVLREDPVRLIRFARFHAIFPEFAVDSEIRKAACDESILELLNKIPAGRIKSETTRLLDCKDAIRGLYFLSYSPGLLSFLSEMYPLDASQKEWVRRTQIDSVNSCSQTLDASSEEPVHI